MRHAVIMAGGAGTRLWPLSRKRRPKHFLRLIEGCSLMRMAYERLAGVLPAEQIHVVTSADHLPLVASELPELPPDNLIGEPAVRDTANAIGLAAVLLNRLDPQGTMGVFTADHVIRPQERFRLAVERAFAAAERFGDALVAIGVRPTSAHTGFGYIQTGRPLAEGLFAAEGFKEKPDLQAARNVCVAPGGHSRAAAPPLARQPRTPAARRAGFCRTARSNPGGDLPDIAKDFDRLRSHGKS
jgi:mannose-1-phosphate guanylyltransferase